MWLGFVQKVILRRRNYLFDTSLSGNANVFWTDVSRCEFRTDKFWVSSTEDGWALQ